ncbi:COG0398: uncharacterized membrane protein / PF00070 family, FAD-dependent NAD(P)-disulphide oxidoreductase [hydrothermal vent metagenome]|uniref:COG0398: uncharacterized membrane protein / PF00070 family, FAD-dependent NAD(P)-disulphide oxidoreductase n=1 Tax=hydrothermal vent metagenome TaxID=652676 RepID=A0A3B1DW01_9ZZZZ
MDESTNEEPDSPPQAAPPSKWRSRLPRLILFLFFVGLFGFIYHRYGDQLNLKSIAAQEEQFRSFQREHPIAVYAVALIIYAVVTGLSLPGATIMTLVYGWFFKFWVALPIVSFASTAGATLSFLFSRYLFRDAIEQKFGERLKMFNKKLEEEGAFYLFSLRLIPAVPFFIINAVMGLTPMRVGTYWVVSQVGMLAGTAVYIYAGSAMPNAQELVEKGMSGIMKPQIMVAFILLGIFPIVVKKLMGLSQKNKIAS